MHDLKQRIPHRRSTLRVLPIHQGGIRERQLLVDRAFDALPCQALVVEETKVGGDDGGDGCDAMRVRMSEG